MLRCSARGARYIGDVCHLRESASIHFLMVFREDPKRACHKVSRIGHGFALHGRRDMLHCSARASRYISDVCHLRESASIHASTLHLFDEQDDF
jgi:carbonic anhydrase/acetyltransferase-like protein (isoleucine patch superfamily)